MKLPFLTQDQKGQAMAEMVICIPILCLLMAGIFQFGVLCTSRVQFEHACGEAARQYAAGLIDKDSLGPKIYENLGSFQKYFDSQSLTVTIQEPQSTANSVMDKVRNAVRLIPFIIDYDGSEWKVDIQCAPPPLFKLLFPGGITFHSVMQVYRYPG